MEEIAVGLVVTVGKSCNLCDGQRADSLEVAAGTIVANVRCVTRARRALQLLAETGREIGTLVLVFAPLETVFAGRPIDLHVLVGVMAGALVLIACAILAETKD